MDTLRGEAQRILDAATGQCREAGERILDGLNGGPIYMHHHSIDEGLGFPDALVGWDGTVGPPHPFAFLIVARYLIFPGHVKAGNLLTTLYHEGSHLLGYIDEDGGTYAFASSCVSQFHPKDVEDVTEPVGGGGGGEDDCQCDDWQPTTCVVRKWFWVDTGEVIGYQVLYCY